MDIIKQLKDDLAEANQTNQKTHREKLRQEEENAAIEIPLLEANKAVKELEQKRITHNRIMDELQEC